MILIHHDYDRLEDIMVLFSVGRLVPLVLLFCAILLFLWLVRYVRLLTIIASRASSWFPSFRNSHGSYIYVSTIAQR